MFRKFVGSQLFDRLKTLQQRGLFRVKHDKEQFWKIQKDFACNNLPPKLKYKFLTMDDMLIPSGSWKDHHTKRNKYYNRVFLFGLISLIGSIVYVKETLFFVAIPPPYPFEKLCDNDDKDDESECEDECKNDC